MSEVFRRLLRWSKDNAAVIGFSFFVFLFLFVDRLVWMSDVTSFNLNGWIGLLHGIIPLFGLLLAPLFLFGRYAKYFYIPVLTFEMALQAIGWFVRINFKMVLDGDWVGIVLGSSKSEIIWFVENYASVSTLLVSLLVVAIMGGVLKLAILASKSSVTRTTVAIGIAGMLVFFYANQLLNVCVYKNFEKLEKQMFGVHLVFDSFRNWENFKQLADMKKNPKIPSTIHAESNLSDEIVGVVVLGESAARSHWGLYGYERATTPCMDVRKKELTVFEDLVTPVGGTAEAMRYVFTTRTIEHRTDLRFTMAQCLKHVGYSVAMFSNQLRWGEWDGDESFDFAGCDPFVFMNEQGETNVFDEVLLPYFTNYLGRVSTKAVVFLHLRGSHVPAAGCYPHDDAPFKPEVFEHSADAGNPALTRNHYDNSIWYTDKILGRIIDELEARHKPTWLLYLSDHGETPSSKSWRTQTDNDLWEVPCIVWTSKEFKEMFPNKIKELNNAAKLPLQSDQLLYGVLNFCGVKGLEVDPREDFLCPTFKCREKRKIQNGRVEYMQENGR